jgi:hypothetical protein
VSLTSPVPDPESGLAFTALGMGAAADIYLARRCVLDLFVRLARDVHESERPEYDRRLREGPKR